MPSAFRPIPHDKSMPVPEPPEEYTLDSESEEASSAAGINMREDPRFFSLQHHTASLDHSS